VHPILKPGVRLLWRDSHTAQLGLDASNAVVIGGLNPPTARLLDRLDGSLDEQLLLRQLAPVRDAEAGQQLLGQLRRAGVLADARTCWPRMSEATRARMAPDVASAGLRGPDTELATELLAARAAAKVEVVGGGRVGACVARLLQAGGVGTVVVSDRGCTRTCDLLPGGWEPADVGRPRERLLCGSDDDRIADLTVLCPHGAALPDPNLTDALSASGAPHLVACVRENLGIVGPLVLADQGTCLQCLHLHHVDADPAWPLLAHQMAHRRPREVDACDVSLASAVAALAARVATAFLERAHAADAATLVDEATSATLELRLADWRVRRRRWPQHPRCPAHLPTDPEDSG
jgi:hypothetical protein